MSRDTLRRIDPLKPDSDLILLGAEIIRRGGLVAFPTETVYGLGANGLDAAAVRRIFEAKGRPQDNPLILHVSSIEEAQAICLMDSRAVELAEAFWPGPLTLVLPAKDCVPLETRGGLATVAVRMPSHPVALELIKASGVPLAAPSANRSGRPSPTEAQSVRMDFGDRVDLILDGGSTRIGVESTVLDVSGEEPLLLRPGGITAEELTLFLGELKIPLSGEALTRSPGTRYRHYAPVIPLLLWEGGNELVDALEASGRTWAYVGIHTPPGNPLQSIRPETLEAYAHALFSSLRQLENSGAEVLIAELPPQEGIGRAIRNRLERAAGFCGNET